MSSAREHRRPLVVHIQSTRRRDGHLRRRGFRVLRFWNHEIYENLLGVLQVIWNAMEMKELLPR